jgi:hypothetical protein
MNHKFTIGFVGDIFLGEKEFVLSPSIQKTLHQCDFVVGNLESPIVCDSIPTFRSRQKSAANKIFLRSKLGSAKKLAQWGIDCVSLANNHIFDYGNTGFQSTVDFLKAARVLHTGAGLNLDQAAKPILFNTPVGSIALIAATHSAATSRLAQKGRSGCNTLAITSLARQVVQLQNCADHIFLLPHWGECGLIYPPNYVFDLAKNISSLKITAIIGSHSHVVQGFTHYPDQPLIAYSLGNFCFDQFICSGHVVQPKDEELRGCILILTLNKKGITQVRWECTRQMDSRIEHDQHSSRTAMHQFRSKPFSNCPPSAVYSQRVQHQLFLIRLKKLLSFHFWKAKGRQILQYF